MVTINGQGLFRQGYKGFEELSHGHATGCSANARMVAKTATPTITTTRGPIVSLFIDSTRPEDARLE